MDNGWTHSAQAWIADMGEQGDFARAHVLDAPMMQRVKASKAETALDVGCGEGRFCRMMAACGVTPTGIDPTAPLLAAARARDPQGTYVSARAETLPFVDNAFDLVVAYLSLIDIADIDAAYAQMLRVLRPGGRLLIANLSSYATALPDAEIDRGWLRPPGGAVPGFGCDHYNEERAYWIGWRGIRVRNFHRPLARYMSPLLAHGLRLVHFDEPAPAAGCSAKEQLFRRSPMFVMMEWQKPSF